MFKNKFIKHSLLASAVTLAISGCGSEQPNTKDVNSQASASPAEVAPGAPGNKPYWAYSGKTGIGTSYEAYVDGAYSNKAVTGDVSTVWFSLAQGIITETMFGLIHQAQLKEMQFVVKGDDFVATELDDTAWEIDYLQKDSLGRPTSLAYKLVNTDKQGRFKIEKHIFTDSNDQTLFVRVALESLNGKPLSLYVHANPYVNNNGVGDSAMVKEGKLIAIDGDNYLTLTANKAFEQTSVGFIGKSDLISQLSAGNELTSYASTGDKPGNVSLDALLGTTSSKAQFDLTLSFGNTLEKSVASAENSQQKGYDQLLKEYGTDWQRYLASLDLESLSTQSADQGRLAYASALVLKAQEDKTHAGALIASLSNPWGDTVPAIEGHTGYKAVWVRDFYQVAMAFLAMGDKQTAKTAFEYLEKVQVTNKTPGNQGDTGWFLQKTHVDGELEWVGVQLDQTAMPIMLGWKLYLADVLTKDELVHWFNKMLKPAADFLVEGGLAKILWNDTEIKPPFTQQERWEEQAGHSPSTTAAVIAGLITASEIAKLAGDEALAAKYLTVAKGYNSQVESRMYTTKSTLPSDASNGQHFVRISQDDDANSSTLLGDNNGRKGLVKQSILDGGFLELVRYGVRSADDKHIIDTLDEYDALNLPENLKVKYNFTFAGVEGEFPGWRRYGNDGYGEDEVTGTNYAEGGNNTPGQRGRVWPFFTGERGHYEIAKLAQSGQFDKAKQTNLVNTYVKGMEQFANEGLMLPEQVWDGVGVNPHNYTFGEGTNSATPLAWTHAEYIKLLRSMSDKQVWDYYPVVKEKLN
ncbi:glycoside hydrolase family 15 protein [Pseudoalteromonas piratica]|uniref:Glucan 1,4-alpha-glucosidase n=1 Tax=Pseudoalteromonas piratica TaxID=1348114 RepID=A0A0A7EHE6_9GAMM|nr:glycoside hydrolase family 15 protein [Pseudoalteromonas piratica]AIY65417.1 glucan 1,4-alpha-glucosidase [Pseudoalteromonas piratica]